MPTLEIITTIAADRQACFDAARDLDLHVALAHESGERIVGGRRSGLIELGETVTFRARHFGVTHEQEARITQFDAPSHFHDEMIRGRFLLFRHDHIFEVSLDGHTTTMIDRLEYRAPCGVLGRLAERLFLDRYLTVFLRNRGEGIRRFVEEGRGRRQ